MRINTIKRNSGAIIANEIRHHHSIVIARSIIEALSYSNGCATKSLPTIKMVGYATFCPPDVFSFRPSGPKDR